MFEYLPDQINLLTGEQLRASGLIAIELAATEFPPKRFDLTSDDFIFIDPSADRLWVCIANERSFPTTYVYSCSGITAIVLYHQPDPPPKFRPENLNPAIKLLANSKIIA